MKCVKKTMSADVVQQIMVLPNSMQNKELEVIVLVSDRQSASEELRGIAAKNIPLEQARRERLSKYETIA